MDEALRELYQEVILDHGKSPRNKGSLPDANRHARGHNPLCGDQVHIHLKLAPEDRIADVRFEGKGCAISMASASLMTEIVKGKTVGEAEALAQAFVNLAKGGGEMANSVSADDLDRLQVMSGVSQFPMRVKCATLAWHTLEAAMAGQGEVSSE